MGVPLPAGPFACILADPPWAFRTFSGENMTPHRCAEDHYSTMSFDELAALPVGDVAAKDCALFMWVAGSAMGQAMDLGAAWGFGRPVTDVFQWLKERMIGAGQVDLFTGDVPEPRMGMGYWSRKQVESCWLFTRGSPRRISKGVRQVIVEPRREHSRTPDAQYERLEALVAGPRLELFARSRRPGWDAWGNQVEKFEVAA